MACGHQFRAGDTMTDKELWTLYQASKQTVGEIASITGKSPSTIKRRLRGIDIRWEQPSLEGTSGFVHLDVTYWGRNWGVLDASELPPTFGVPEDIVIGLIAGGDRALRHAVEKAEDFPEKGWQDLQAFSPTKEDSVLGIAASGTTPYVVGTVRDARKNGLLTGCITSNPDSPLAAASDYPIETIVGPEFVTGSSRMKSGTAQKMVLNMISTSLMIRLGRVQDNRMVNMQLTSTKLVNRGVRMLQELLGLDADEARQRLLEAGSVNEALKSAL